MGLANRVFAEGVGTFGLVFCGCGAIVVNDLFGGQLGHLGVSTVFGLIVMAMIYSFGNVSGAHINPAVTIAFAVSGRLRTSDVPPYVTGQLAGAIAAALALKLLFPAHVDLGATLPAVPAGQAFAVEVVLSFLLMLVILNVSTGHKEKGIMAGAAIGATVGLAALIGGPVTGASMNPARSVGPALASLQLVSLWLYVAAPLVGMLLAVPACRWSQGRDCCSGVLSDGRSGA